MSVEDRSSQVFAVAILFFILSWVTVSLRVYVRKCLINSFGVDDYVMLLALGFFTAYLICQLGGAAHGTGQHRSAITDENAQTALMFWFLCEVFYTLSTSVLKIAIGLFLLRITVERVHVWIIRFIMVSSACVGTTYCFIAIFQCRPVSFWWDLNPHHTGRCLSANTLIITTFVISSLNAFADWVFAVLPVFIVYKLQMKRQTKAIVAFVLGLGALGSTATIVRMPYLVSGRQYKGDFLYRTTDVAIWTTVEVGVGITAGCMATLRPLLVRILRALGVRNTAVSTSSNPYPWTGSKKGSAGGKHGYVRSGCTMDEISSYQQDKNTTITTVTGVVKNTSWTERPRIGSSDDIFSDLPPGAASFDMKVWRSGISKSVEITTAEEFNTSQSDIIARTDEEYALSPRSKDVFERF